MRPLQKADRQSILLLVAVVVICFLLFPYVDKWVGWSADGVGRNGRVHEKAGDASRSYEGGEPAFYAVASQKPELFAFDPNTADSTQLLRLGLKPWQVRNIYKYRAAGGRYRKPADFARLYGLTLEEYERLSPYIIIKEQVMAADVYGGNDVKSGDLPGSGSVAGSAGDSTGRASSAQGTTYPRKIRPGEKVDITVADTNTLKTIPGIGSYFARQIVRYREQLGGYVAVSQLKEIDNFPEHALQYASIGSEVKLRKLRINVLDQWKMSHHPYVRYIQAKEIVEYRQRNGNVTSLQQLLQLSSITQHDLSRLAPYLDFSR